jgi:hypothetical protein
MPLKKTRNGREEVSRLVQLLTARYQSEPAKFRSYLPEIAQLLDRIMPPRPKRLSPFTLTDHERSRRLVSLESALLGLGQSGLTKEDAVRALEDYAVLLEDDRVPEKFDFEKRIGVFKVLFGKSPGSFKAQTTLLIDPDSKERAVNSIALVRGVVLDLSWDMKLLKVHVSPQRFRERKKLLSFVGIGYDSASDVASRHDEYFAETLVHGST